MSGETAVLVYPHQLYSPHPAITAAPGAPVFLVEEPLLLRDVAIHPIKRHFHEQSMANWAASQEIPVSTVRAGELKHTGEVVPLLRSCGYRRFVVADPVDDWLERRLAAAAAAAGVELEWTDAPGFLLGRAAARTYAAEHPRMRMVDFYRMMRRSFDILIEPDGGPTGGSWSFDTENRRKIPRSLEPPPSMVGADPEPFPTSADGAMRWLDRFLETRLRQFGDYEDAVDDRDDQWFHSLLTPMLNVGLLTPETVLRRTREAAESARRAGDPVPLNSLEGFIRQVLGWREFMRVAYVAHGGTMRTRNFWNHSRPMPPAFYDGTTGLPPFDAVVHKARRLSWANHIERLMIAGNFMLLCEIDPDAVYRWFMELFVDAYDWVMVPNVYAMSQYADGGLITTKPYIGGSNYIRKMSNFGGGAWQEVWDGLYWRFVARHRAFFDANQRMRMMVRQLDRLEEERKKRIFSAAEDFLERL
ncbi:MAG: cryptochrome/photolyase family protein [Spirochaeta sp.]|nr:cryptochrome/photolyase family protein [Spirochaeta sp.]